MWKLVSGKSEQLPELLVVLAITVVMAAILLPAVTGTHGNEVNAQSDNGILMDGPVRSASESRDVRRERAEGTRATATEAVLEEPEAAGDATESADEAVEPAITPVEQQGLEKIRTTDISYVIP